MLWKQIKETTYEISSTGQVRNSITGKNLSIFTTSQNNYCAVGLQIAKKRKIFYVHHLVMEAFGHPKPFPKAIIRHLDDDTGNNNISNLAWGTAYDNYLDRIKNNLLNGREDKFVKLSLDQALEIKEDRLKGVSIKELAKKYSITAGQVSHIATGKRWKVLEGRGYDNTP